MLDKAYAETGKVYAKLKMAIESGKCSSDNCDYEYKTPSCSRVLSSTE